MGIPEVRGKRRAHAVFRPPGGAEGTGSFSLGEAGEIRPAEVVNLGITSEGEDRVGIWHVVTIHGEAQAGDRRVAQFGVRMDQFLKSFHTTLGGESDKGTKVGAGQLIQDRCRCAVVLQRRLVRLEVF